MTLSEKTVIMDKLGGTETLESIAASIFASNSLSLREQYYFLYLGIFQELFKFTAFIFSETVM